MKDNRYRVSIDPTYHPELHEMFEEHMKNKSDLTGFIQKLFYNSRFHIENLRSTEWDLLGHNRDTNGTNLGHNEGGDDPEESYGVVEWS